MFNIGRNNKITLTKGDTATLALHVYEQDGTERPVKSTDHILLTIRKTASTPTVSMQSLANDEGKFTILPSATSSLECGTYVYDVQLTTAEGNVYTVIPLSIFELSEEITR